jgi:hypothetical protein
MPRHKFEKGNTFASKEHKKLVALTKTPEERQAGKTLLKNRVRSLTVSQILEENAEAIMDKLISLALQGDSTCMKLCVERLIPPKKLIQMESKISAMGILGMFPVAQEEPWEEGQ